MYLGLKCFRFRLNFGNCFDCFEKYTDFCQFQAHVVTITQQNNYRFKLNWTARNLSYVNKSVCFKPDLAIVPLSSSKISQHYQRSESTVIQHTQGSRPHRNIVRTQGVPDNPILCIHLPCICQFGIILQKLLQFE